LINALTYLGGLGLTVGLIAAACWGLFRAYGDKWLASRFDQQLEDYKFQQQRELERLRFEINALLDRATKLHQHEFEVLPRLWQELNDAYGEVVTLVSPFQSTADLNKMSTPQLKDFIEDCPLASWQKQELLRASDKTNEYMSMIFWHRLSKARKVYSACHSDVVSSGIFLEPLIHKQMLDLSEMMHLALIEKETDQRHPNLGPGRFDRGAALRREGEGALLEIGEQVRKRLWQTSLPTTESS
jgi:hypothetical protein